MMRADDALVEREREILGLLERGLSDREIAEKCFLSLNTVKWYNHQIYAKLGVSSRTQAISQARQLGLLNTPHSAKSISAPTSTDSVVPTNRLALTKNSLPVEATRFIGRQRETAEIKRALQTTRLLTLTGSPGAGKTRLCVHVAWQLVSEFPDGIYFVNLASIQTSDFILACIASALRIDQRENEPLIATVAAVLGAGQRLLVLDNFEHVIDGAGQIAELLRCTQLKIMVTSRELLHIYGEHEYAVPAMQLPDEADTATISQSEAVALFVQQAQAAKSNWILGDDNQIDVARICIRLEGLPLAIELAAAQLKRLSPQTLLQRLSHPFQALVGGPRDLPLRQQTLRQTIDWSYDLLDSDETVLFARLSVFAGGWTIEAAEEVCAQKPSFDVFAGLESLLNKSLIHQYEVEGNLRFGMLQMLREYASEKLQASGEHDIINQLHACYYTELARRVTRGMQERPALDNLELEHDNFRAVMRWSAAGNPEFGLRLMAELSQCWRMRGHLLEGWRWTQDLLVRLNHVGVDVQVAALTSASLLANNLGKVSEARQLGEDALALSQQIDDPLLRAWSILPVATSRLQVQMTETESQAIETLFGQALQIFRAKQDKLGSAKTLVRRGELQRLRLHWDAAAADNYEALQLFGELNNVAGLSICHANLGWVMMQLGDETQALRHFLESIDLAQQILDRNAIVNALAGLAACAARANHDNGVAQLFGAIESQLRLYGDRFAPTDQVDYDVHVEMVRQRISPDAFERNQQSGAMMTLEQAIAHAIKFASGLS